MTTNSHTKFEHNRPSRFRDTEARCGGYLCTWARAEIPHPWLLHKAVTNGSPTAYQISMQSAQLLLRNSRRNICDIPPGSTRHVPQWVLAWFGIGPIHGRRNGGTHQRRPLANRAFGSRDISLSKAWPRPAGRSYSEFSLILSRTRSAFGLARNNQHAFQ